MKYAMFSLMVAASAVAGAVEVDRMLVRQQSPWDGTVRIDYRLKGFESAARVSARVFNGETELSAEQVSKGLSGDLYVIDERDSYSLSFDPEAAFDGAGAVVPGELRVELSVTDSGLPPNLSEKVYRIVDLVTSNVTDYTRADFYNGRFGRFEDVVSTNYFDFATTKTCELDDVFIWTDVTNHEEYLTTKIVLRRIPAAGKTYTMQAGTDFAHAVSFEKDFYLGIYEVSEGQYSNAVRQVADCMKPYPMNTSYKTYIGSSWLDYPEKDRTEQQPGGFLNWLRVKTKPSGTYYFHLPTEAEWEFACRAGYTGSTYYNGGTVAGDIQWTSGNRSGNTGALGGLKPPNAFGLYDMLGNYADMCIDWYAATLPTTAVTDPKGPSKGESEGVARVVRGGNSYGSGTVNTRARPDSITKVSRFVARVWCPAD